MNSLKSTASSFLVLVLLTPCFGLAQTNSANLTSNMTGGSTANFYYAKPGDLTIIVNVWGFVQNPGCYEISTSIDLVQLVSLAGGPSEFARLDNIRITRFVSGDKGGQKLEFLMNLEELGHLSEADVKLRPGDVIYVDRSNWSIWKDVFSITATVAVLVVAVVNLLNVSQR